MFERFFGHHEKDEGEQPEEIPEQDQPHDPAAVAETGNYDLSELPPPIEQPETGNEQTDKLTDLEGVNYLVDLNGPIIRPDGFCPGILHIGVSKSTDNSETGYSRYNVFITEEELSHLPDPKIKSNETAKFDIPNLRQFSDEPGKYYSLAAYDKVSQFNKDMEKRLNSGNE